MGDVVVRAPRILVEVWVVVESAPRLDRVFYGIKES